MDYFLGCTLLDLAPTRYIPGMTTPQHPQRRVGDKLVNSAKRAMNEHNGGEQRTLYADLCASAVEGFDAMALDVGCSRAALLDALGHALCSGTVRELLITGQASPLWTALQPKAREIDAQRRRRTR